jgi:hypothetical protein
VSSRGKRQLNVLISEDLYRRLIEVAPRLCGGRYRGALSAIVEEALRYYLDLKTKTPTSTPEPPQITHVDIASTHEVVTDTHTNSVSTHTSSVSKS